MDGKRKNMLEIIFKAREEKLASLNSEDKNFFKVHNIDRSARRNSLLFICFILAFFSKN